MSDVFHLDLTKDQLQGARLAIVPGDPARVERIAAQFDRWEPLASKREYTSALAFVGDTPLVVCSTGIGGPSTSIAVEELAQLGVDTFLRVGTTGAIQPDIAVGDVIITTGAVRLDGASYHFAPAEYPAVATYDCVSAFVDSAQHVDAGVHLGVTASSDTFYPGQERYDTVSGFVRDRFRGSADEWRALNVLNYEMEGATLLTMCAVNGWRAGMVAGVLVNRNAQEIPDPSAHERAESNAVAVVVGAATALVDS